MGIAMQDGGLYYRNGVAVDANGNVVADAPPLPPESIPAAPVVQKSFAEEIADAIKSAGGAVAPISGELASAKFDITDQVADGVVKGLTQALPAIVSAVQEVILEAQTAPAAPAAPAEVKPDGKDK